MPWRVERELIMRLSLFALALLAGCGHVFADAQFLDRFIWTNPSDGFGGISAIEVSADGASFVAVGDSGTLINGQFQRQNGQIVGIDVKDNLRLSRTNGAPLRGKNRDAEGLAIGPNGTIYVSFEGNARVLAYPVLNGPATALPRHRDFAGMQSNSALESLAMDAAGRLYTLPERSGRANRPFPVYRLDGGQWTVAMTLPRRGAFLAVGLDIGPDGNLYLLERDFTGIGFRTRVRRFDAEGGSEETILQTRTGSYDNLEGISVWRDTNGQMRLTMVSDDNFRFYQRTEIVEFVLTQS